MDIPYEMREIAGKNVRESKFDICVGDMFAMVSDGVVFAGVGTILNLGWQWENVAQYFLECAQKNMSVHRIAQARSMSAVRSSTFFEIMMLSSSCSSV